MLRWLDKSPHARLLTDLAKQDAELSHAHLDALPPGKSESYVRALLVHTGVLPERDELERLPPWLDTLLVGVPADHARLVRTFLQWHLLRRARRRAAATGRPARSIEYLRQRIRVAFALLAWLDQQGVALAELDQTTLERWLGAGATTRYDVRYFLAWATNHRLAPAVSVPALPRCDPVNFLTEDQRWPCCAAASPIPACRWTPERRAR